MRTSVCALAMLVVVARSVAAQAIPTTVAQAEAGVVSLAHLPPPTVAQPAFSDRPFGGSSERKCVASVRDEVPAGGSLRSGEFIIRMHFTGAYGLHAGKASKILWMPLHDPGRQRISVLIRAARLENPSDSLRLTFPGVARSVGYSGEGREFGFPSTISFPASGPWLVVATTGDDWGCFVLDVAD